MASPRQGAMIVLLGFILAIMGTAFMPTIAEQVNQSEQDLDSYDYTEASDLWRLIPLVTAAAGVIFIVGGILLTLM